MFLWSTVVAYSPRSSLDAHRDGPRLVQHRTAHTMASLLSLPNELLISVLIACSDIDTAISLADSTPHLRAIWEIYADSITKRVLQRSLPAYNEAVALAVAGYQHSMAVETDCASSTDPPLPKTVSLRRILPILKRRCRALRCYPRGLYCIYIPTKDPRR